MAALGLLGSVAVGNGRADGILVSVAGEMGTWRASQAAVDRTSREWIRTDLLRAVTLDPADPMVHELLGLAESQDTAPEYQRNAIVHFTRALELRPVSAYSWANLVEATYRVGGSGKDMEVSIARASALGPSEPVVQRIVAEYGLAVWNEVGPDTRASIERMVAAGLRRNPLEMLQISERRGRLGIACRHVSGVPRTNAASWSKFCSSREATQ